MRCGVPQNVEPLVRLRKYRGSLAAPFDDAREIHRTAVDLRRYRALLHPQRVEHIARRAGSQLRLFAVVPCKLHHTPTSSFSIKKCPRISIMETTWACRGSTPFPRELLLRGARVRCSGRIPRRLVPRGISASAQGRCSMTNPEEAFQPRASLSVRTNRPYSPSHRRKENFSELIPLKGESVNSFRCSRNRPLPVPSARAFHPRAIQLWRRERRQAARFCRPQRW